MLYPAFLERCPDGSYGIGFPDVLGCVSAGDTVEEAIAQGAAALAFHLEGMAEDGEAMPRPDSIERHRASADWQTADVWVLVDADPPQVASRAQRINITLPERMLAQIDAAAEREGVSRSRWLQRVASAALLRGGSVRPGGAPGAETADRKRGPEKPSVKKNASKRRAAAATTARPEG